MSLFRTVELHCPACREAITFQSNSSVNADRRPDLRDAIVDGTFQTQTCPACNAGFRLDPELNYLEVREGLWIAAFPFARLGEWEAIEAMVRESFEIAYGARASASAREIGNELTPRLVFGWAALREKIVAKQSLLDDVTLELMKMAMLRGMPDVPLSEQTELRLIAAEGDQLIMAWINGSNAQVVQKLGVPTDLYREIQGDPDGWAPLRAQVSEGLFVDMQRLMIGTPE